MKNYDFKIDDYVKGDCFDYLPKIPNNSVDLIFTSPPDISDTPYEKSSEGIELYKEFQKNIMNEFSRIIKEDGFVVITQTDRKILGSVLQNHSWYSKCMDECGMKLKDYKIVVRNKVGKKDMYYFTFQHMLIFTYEGIIKRGGDWLKDIIVDKQFFLQPKNKIRQYIWSEKYCRYVIENLTDEGDMVIDPFAGVGIVLSTSKKLNRHYWGAEISNEYYNEGFKNIYE